MWKLAFYNSMLARIFKLISGHELESHAWKSELARAIG